MKTKTPFTLFIGLVVCVFVLSACTTTPEASNTTQETMTQTENTNKNNAMIAPDQDPLVSDTSDNNDGAQVYEETVRYTNPGGGDEVGFKLTVTNGVVTDADAEVKATNSTSVNRQLAFKSAFKQAVVGKPIDGLTVDRVGGSSLTSKAFNEWVSTLE